MIAAAGLSIRQGRRVFPTVKPVSRTAGAKTQPSGRAASRVAVTQHRWPVSMHPIVTLTGGRCQSAPNRDPPPEGEDRWGGGDIENAPEPLGDIERSVASLGDIDALLPV